MLLIAKLSCKVCVHKLQFLKLKIKRKINNETFSFLFILCAICFSVSIILNSFNSIALSDKNMFNLLFQSRDWEPIIVSTQLWGKAAFDVTNAKHNFPTQL